MLWPGLICNCTHPKDSHADEHDEVPTGTGHCTIPGCGCTHYTRSTSTQLAQEPITMTPTRDDTDKGIMNKAQIIELLKTLAKHEFFAGDIRNIAEM
jgi:hypothetical protein